MAASFFSSAVATEADADRAFYEAVKAEFHIEAEMHFAAGQGKQSLTRLIGSFRALGVRTAAIVDFDIFRKEDEFCAILTALTDDRPGAAHFHERYRVIIGDGVQSAKQRATEMITAAEARISQIKAQGDAAQQLSSLKRFGGYLSKRSDVYADLKGNGLLALPQTKQEEVRQLLLDLRRCGLFVVPVGELENWLTFFGIPTSDDKPEWVRDALESLPRLRLEECEVLRSFIRDLESFGVGGPVGGSWPGKRLSQEMPARATAE